MQKFIRYLSLCLLLIFGIFDFVVAQKTKRPKIERSPQQTLLYTDHTYLPSIRSISVFPKGQEDSFPIIQLGSDDVLIASFDDLRADVRNLYFSLEFCNTQWQTSTLSPLEYSEGYNEERIRSVHASMNTLQAYTHYSFTFPSEQVKPKLPGNYLLKVYEDADKRRLLFTRKVYFYAPQFNLVAEIGATSDPKWFSQHQKLDVVVQGTTQTSADPYRDVRLLVIQNQRNDIQQEALRPLILRENEWVYNDLSAFSFGGGTEFRYLDLRSLLLPSQQMLSMVQERIWQINLYADTPIKGAYAFTQDHNGRFFFRNMDRQEDPLVSDYAMVQFELKEAGTPANYPDGLFLLGGFNAYQIDPAYQLQYDPLSDSWKLETLLKQGVYDYTYSSLINVENKTKPIDQSFRETGNSYQLLLYVRRPGTTWDEILGYRTVFTGSPASGIRN